jgi:hypothetical protein
LHAHDTAVLIAQRFNLTVNQAAAIIAVLSPRNKWARNVRDAIGLCKYGTEYKTSTFGRNTGKALNIIEGKPVCDYVKGNKVEAFHKLIVNPLDSNTVCVDTWAIALALNIKPSEVGTLTDKNYSDLSLCYVNVAREVNITPWQMQAVTWLWIREQRYDYVSLIDMDTVTSWLAGYEFAF